MTSAVDSVSKIRLVLSGDSGTGKSVLLNDYLRGEYHSLLPLSTTDNQETFIKDIEYQDKQYRLEIVDTIENGMTSEASTHELYQEAQCVLFTYAINDLKSFNNLISLYGDLPINFDRATREKWTIIDDDKLRKFPPILLVGTKSDLQMDRQVSQVEANNVCSELGLNGYMECSSLMDIGVADIFQRAIQLAVEYSQSDNDYHEDDQTIQFRDVETVDRFLDSCQKKEEDSEETHPRPATPEMKKKPSSKARPEKAAGCCVVM